MLLDDSFEPGTPLGDVLPLGDDVLEIETGYNRPDLTSVYGIAREVAALTGAALNPMPGVESEAGRRRVGRDPDRGPRALPRVPRQALSHRRRRRVTRLAEGAAAACRHASDLERRRRHQLRDARARQPAARVRLLEARGRPDHRAARGARREARDPRRQRSGARSRGPGHRRRRASDRDRRRDGRRGHRGVGRDDRGPAGSGELRAAHRPAERRAPPHAHREPDALGEGRRPVPGAERHSLCIPAARGACRRQLGRWRARTAATCHRRRSSRSGRREPRR